MYRGISTIWKNHLPHLTSKWRGTFQYFQSHDKFFFNVENSIKREMRKNCFSKKKKSTPPPPDFFFLHQFFFLMLEIPWNAKKTWNIEKKNLKILFFSIFKKFIKIKTTFHQYQKLYSTPPWLCARTCKVSRKCINAFSSYSAKTKRDGQTDRQDRRTDRQTDGGALQYLPSRAFCAAGDKAPREIITNNTNIIIIQISQTLFRSTHVPHTGMRME